jgi:predicted phage terminase large subunit-like protein
MASYTNTLFGADFPSFCHEGHKICRGGETLNNDPYLLQVYAMAEDIADGRVTKAIINMPPGTAKSFVMAVCLPAWILAHDPSATVMVVEHNKKQARDATRNIRRIMRSEQFRRSFKTRIDENWKGAGDFGTTKAGSVYATSIKGGITGYRADCIIVDDPLSIKNANNPEEIDFVNETFDDEILSRMRDEDSRVVVIMHRLNENDLTAHLTRMGGYKKLVIPLIAEKDKTYTCRYGNWDRKKGEQIRIGRYSKAELRALAFRPSFRFLYQQDKGGGANLRIRSRHFAYFDGRRIAGLPFVFSIDTSEGGGENSSRMAIQVWQSDGHDHYLINIFSAAQCTYQRLWDELTRLVHKYSPALILVEKASTGSVLISQIEARLRCDVLGVIPRKSKSVRLWRNFKTIRSGRIHIPLSADWALDWVAEIVAFPDGKYDDHVDCLSMLLDNALMISQIEQRREPKVGLVMVNGHGLTRRILREEGPGVPGTGALATATGLQQGWNGRPRSSPDGGSAPLAFCATPWGTVIRRPT